MPRLIRDTINLKLTTNTNQVKRWFLEERGNRSSRRKPLGAEKRTNKLNPHMTPDQGIEPGPHWWEASALTTAPSLHPWILDYNYGWIPGPISWIPDSKAVDYGFHIPKLAGFRIADYLAWGDKLITFIYCYYNYYFENILL